ncbi:MAG: EamA family transporter RarD [Rhodocyclaceae bacterium]|nr:EamA family transporter RarD [Rhodocyclaceae bacterium]MBX3671241.1 EamA family transporter RarD [Rhodocyclaceae bacterium]
MEQQKTLTGIACGLAAYGMWGFFPLFFRQLAQVAPADLLCNRAFWGCAFVSLVLTVRRQWHLPMAALRRPQYVLRLFVAALLVGLNWLVFLWAIDQHRVIAASLGYFLTPLVSVLLGMLVLKERLNGKEWLSVALALLAVANEFFTLGSLPWVSLVLGVSFGLYGLVRKQVPVDAVSGLWLETMSMLPLLAAYALWQGAAGHSVLTGFGLKTQALLVVAGALTALPLMFFAAATQRLSLVTVGMLMYINPTMQFLTAVWIFGEPLQSGRLFTFALIWAGLVLYSWSGWSKYRRARAA